MSRTAAFLMAMLMLCATVEVRSAEVAIAGFAFAGRADAASQRFPYSHALFKRLQLPGAGLNLSRQIGARAATLANPALNFLPPETLVNLKHRDQALMTVLLLTGETVSTENFGSYYKTFVNLRGDVLLFDYKSKTVVRSYPISVVFFDASAERPSTAHIETVVERLLTQNENLGLLSQYIERLGSATLPAPGQRTLQVKHANFAPEASLLMPAALRTDPALLNAMLADSFASILSARTGVAILPSSAGQALATMSMRLENGDDYELKIGTGDYLFDLTVNKFAKVKTAETRVGTAFIYGAYASVRFYEPGLGTDYLNTNLKNGESAVVPAGLLEADDFAAYQDALRGLFLKLSDAIAGSDAAASPWLAKAASAKDIEQQLVASRAIIKASK